MVAQHIFETVGVAALILALSEKARNDEKKTQQQKQQTGRNRKKLYLRK